MSQNSAGVIISSMEIAEEEKKDDSDHSNYSSPKDVAASQTASRPFNVDRGQQRRVIASQEFENEEKRDLQQILMEKLQLSLPRILEEDQTRGELLVLPREALELLFSNSETCLSEF